MRFSQPPSKPMVRALPASSIGLRISLFLLLFLCSSVNWAQDSTATNSMPSWSVLVLKLVSATHVQPTTGIVLAAPDLVLVAMDFAREGDEVMVLDGGTDIVRHGRPARIIHTLPADRLAILKVQGLNRPAVSLSAANEAALKALTLVAFPPAEMIAKGATPVRSKVKALPALTTTHPTLDPFPNVSGALTDSCGHLVAVNMAVDVQSMQATASPRLAWREALLRAAELTGVALQSVPCTASDAAAAIEPEVAALASTAEAPQDKEAQPDAEEASNLNPDDLENNEPEPNEELDNEGEIAASEPEPENPEESLTEEPAPELLDDLSVAAPETAGESSGSETSTGQPRSFSSITILISLFAAALLILWWYFVKWSAWKRKKAETPGTQQDPIINEASPKEPGTVRFDTLQAAAPIHLQVQGQLANGEGFSHDLPIHDPGWMAELGRQDADVDLLSSAVSRRHARLQIHEGHITISDLGSTNGTLVNDVPCLPGEVFYVQPGDKLQLGDVTFTLQLKVSDD